MRVQVGVPIAKTPILVQVASPFASPSLPPTLWLHEAGPPIQYPMASLPISQEQGGPHPPIPQSPPSLLMDSRKWEETSGPVSFLYVRPQSQARRTPETLTGDSIIHDL